MRVLGFVVIVLGIVLAYIGITGSQHRVMSIITRKGIVPTGQPVNTAGGNTPAPTPMAKTTSKSKGTLV